MCFIVVDGRTKEQPGFQQVQVTPYLYRQANLAIYQQSIFFRNGIVQNCNEPVQHEKAEFANQWLDNIQAEGFIR